MQRHPRHYHHNQRHYQFRGKAPGHHNAVPAFFFTVRCRSSRLCRICIKILWSSRTAVNIVVHCRRCCPVVLYCRCCYYGSIQVIAACTRKPPAEAAVTEKATKPCCRCAFCAVEWMPVMSVNPADLPIRRSFHRQANKPIYLLRFSSCSWLSAVAFWEQQFYSGCCYRATHSLCLLVRAGARAGLKMRKTSQSDLGTRNGERDRDTIEHKGREARKR